MIMKIYLITLLALLFVFVAQAQEKISKSFEGVNKMSINLASGDCTLKKGATPTIRVELQYTYDNDEFKPQIEQKGSKLIIKEKFEGQNHSGWSKWTITIPDGLEVTVNSGSGDLTIGNLKLEIKTNSGSGDMDLSDTSGDVTINTGSGDVEINTQDGEISVNTGSGDVWITSGKGNVKINTGSGDIRIVNSNADFSINTGSGDITANDITIAGKSGFNSGSGDTSVTFGSSLDYDISVNSGSGDAVLDFNNNEINGVVTMQANKRNGRIAAPFEFDKVEEEKHGSQTIIKKTVRIGSTDIKIHVGTGSGKAEITN